MRTRQSYNTRSEKVAKRFARMRKRKEEIKLAQPPPDYPPIRIAGTLSRSITLRDHKTERVTIIELRVPESGRSDQFSVTVNGLDWPRHGRAVGISYIRRAIV